MCQLQHVEPQRQSSDREPGLLSNFAKGSSPPVWEPKPGLPDENGEQSSTPTASEPRHLQGARGGGGLEAQVQWRAGHTMQINLGWNQR